MTNKQKILKLINKIKILQNKIDDILTDKLFDLEIGLDSFNAKKIPEVCFCI